MFLYISYLIFSIYIISIIFFIIGISKIKDNHNSQSDYDDISIIVCVRNGEESVINILRDLKSQNYNGNLEFIIVDDDSNDNGGSSSAAAIGSSKDSVIDKYNDGLSSNSL